MRTSIFPFWPYRQLTHFLSSSGPTVTWNRQLSPFETLCSRNTPQRHLISYIYTLLQDDTDPSMTQPARASWEADLHLTLTDDDWDSIYTFAHKGSLNVAIQENGYKIITKLYRMPARLHKFSPSVSNVCWRCKGAIGSMIHIWWECPALQPFWREVHSIISRVTTYTLDYNPAQYLLHYSTLPKHTYQKWLAMHMVNAARLCIPTHWRSTDTPTIREWLSRIAKIEEMEELIYTSQERIQKFTKTWACWTHFKNSDYHKSFFPL